MIDERSESVLNLLDIQDWGSSAIVIGDHGINMEFNYISIYSLSEINRIKDYEGPFCGAVYDNDEKIRIAREMARWYAEIGPSVDWESYYPTNEEMNGMSKMINRLMKRKTITRQLPESDFRFSLIIDYIMCYKKIYDIRSFGELIEKKEFVIKTITDIINF